MNPTHIHTPFIITHTFIKYTHLTLLFLTLSYTPPKSIHLQIHILTPLPKVDPKQITTLPPTWDFCPSAKRQSSSNPAEATRYRELVTTLQSLSTRQRESAERVARLRRMQRLLEPFSPTEEEEDDQPQLQNNLVTRNGQIESELQKMRMLLVRVGGRVDQLQQQNEKGKGKQRRGKRVRQEDEGDGDDARMTDAVNLDSRIDERKKFDDLLQRFS